MSIVSQNIKYLRRMNGLTQEQFARRLGIKRSLVGAYEEARANPPLDKLKLIANSFNISVDSLIKNDIRKVRETPDMRLAFDKQEKPQPIKDVASEFLTKIQSSQTSIPAPKPSVFETENTNGHSSPPPKPPEERPVYVPPAAAATVFQKDTFLIIELHQQIPYINNLYNPAFLANYPTYSLPGIKGDKLRGFQMGNDFPVRNSVVIGELFENMNQLIDGDSYLLVTRSSGIIYRRIYNQLSLKNKLLLSSDVPGILSQEIDESDILEIWDVRGYYTTEIPKPNSSLGRLEKLLNEATTELDRMKKRHHA